MTSGRLPAQQRTASSGSSHECSGETVDAVTLIPRMLETFMARDRGFRWDGGTQARRGLG